MSLQIVAGGSGAGKSTYIYSDVIEKSMKYPEKNYIVVVPEQYTMATQKKLVESHPRKGILNIDVVSFERLSYKVFEEIGGQNHPVLDDTGKNLIVRKVLGDNRDKLRYFGSNINKTGFVSELKSVISEFLQYDIDVKRLGEIRERVEDSRQLSAKLDDISVVYSAFKEYLADNYITSEEILSVLCSVIDRSENIKRSEIILDGFTGFTPIQYRLIELLLIYSGKVTVSVTADSREKLNVNEGIQQLFFMSKEMVSKLYRICDVIHVDVLNPIILDNEKNPRFVSDEIAFLEKNIFRNNNQSYNKKCEDIKIITAQTPKEELNYCISEILRLTRYEGYRYRDIAIVSADMASYGILAGNICRQNRIPCFVDNKKPVTDNPFVEYIRSALEIIEKSFTYDSMFRYLRSGMSGISREDVDLLDNYCLAVGIRGSKQWHGTWVKKGRGRSAYPLDYLNELREKIMKEYGEGEKQPKKKRILLTGCPSSGAPMKVVKALEENGAVVVAYENCGGTKSADRLIDESAEDIYEAIAERYLQIGCSVMTPNKNRYELLGRLIEEYKVDGVVEMTLQACHTYNVEAKSIEKFVKGKGVPYIHVETDYSQEDIGQLNTRMTAFVEML